MRRSVFRRFFFYYKKRDVRSSTNKVTYRVVQISQYEDVAPIRDRHFSYVIVLPLVPKRADVETVMISF